MKYQDSSQATFLSKKILFSEIEFFTSEEVTLIGEIEVNGRVQFAQYVTNKKNLYTMLKHSGKVGQEIIHVIIDAFNKPHEVPVTIRLTERYGKAVCLKHCLLKLDRSFYKNDLGEWKIDYKTNLFYIDAVKPLEATPVPKEVGLF